jgi:hypothetical protein
VQNRHVMRSDVRAAHEAALGRVDGDAALGVRLT